jgi:raffinose/stachyose/melibiose transport system substrate-binding protein
MKLLKKLRALGLLGITALVLAGCAPATQEPTATAPANPGATAEPVEPVTLTMWSWRTEDVEAYNKIFAVYEAANPGVTVEFEAFLNTEYGQILATGLEGSGGPDLAMVRSYGGVQGLIEAGQLLPIDGLVDVSSVDQSLLLSATGREDGKLYGVPFATQTLVMYYNKGIFSELGYSEPPKTWDEYIEVNEAIIAAGYTGMAIGAKDAWMLPMVHEIFGAARYGAPEFRQALLAGTKDFNDPDYVASLEVFGQMRRYMDKDVIGIDYASSQIQFTSGLAAQYPGGSFELANFKAQAPDMDLGVYLVPPPPGSVSSKPLSAAWGDGSFAINSKSPNQEAALKLLNWLASPEFGQLFVDEVKQFSAITGLDYTDPLMRRMNELYQAGPSVYINLVDMRYGSPSGTYSLSFGMEYMLLDEMNATQAAAMLQSDISEWFVPGA